MDVVLEGNSSRRGSLSSLCRQPSGSLSTGTRLVSGSQNPQSASSGNINNLYKDLDKFTRYFIIKSIQVIVQARIGERVRSESKPTGNDWFNLNIVDLAEVSERTKAVIDSDGLSVKSNWRVCCEISLRTNDGGSVILEHWIISNKSLTGSQNNLNSALKLSSNKQPPRSPSSDRWSPVHFSSSHGGSVKNANSTTPGSRTRTFSHRTRLNSIDDCSDEPSSFGKAIGGNVGDTSDIKSSSSCFALSSTTTPSCDHGTSANANSFSGAANSAAGQSPSTNTSLSNQQGSTRSSSSSSIYTIYNKMSLLLKTLMTTSHIVPAFKLASKTSPTDPYVICYRIYTCPPSFQAPRTNVKQNKSSSEDVSLNIGLDSPGKRSCSSDSSFKQVNIRDFVCQSEMEYFCPIMKLGSIKTSVNELDASLCYRTDLNNSYQLFTSPKSRDLYRRIFHDDECITAAKQLLAGNENNNQYTRDCDIESTQKEQELYNENSLNSIDQPLRPAFAYEDFKTTQDPNLNMIESVFDGLLKVCNQADAADAIDHQALTKESNRIIDSSKQGTAQSEPIQVPPGTQRIRQGEIYPNMSSGSTPKSLTDSFVFVDLNPPFASEEQNDLNSFFHGPSPIFSNGYDCLKDFDELTNQLAAIEANASQIDDFVDNICVSEDEDECDD